jgi:Ca2+-binding RTX toxin-like protein
MAYPFHRIDDRSSLDTLVSKANLCNPFNRSRFRRAPGWKQFRAGHRASLMEPMEPRLLLSADFMPAAADAMVDGFDDFQDRLEDFFASELDQRVPFLLLEDPFYDAENPDPDDAPFEAPSILDLFSIPVDANGDGEINNPLTPFDLTDDDEDTLSDWDTSGDGVVDSAELLEGLLFEPLRTVLGSVDGTTTTEELVYALVGDGILSFGFDELLDDLGPDYTVDFDLLSAIDLTEDPDDAEVVFSLQFSLSITRPEVVVDFGLEADDLKLLAFTGDSLNPGPVTLPITSTLSFGLEFGVYTGGQDELDLDAADFFIRRADDMLFSVTDNKADGTFNFDLNIGFLGADVVGGSVDFQADILATLVDPDTPEILGFDTDQYGVEQASGVVVADGSIPDVDLPHEAGFVLRIGNLGIAKDIVVEADDNTTNADLVADIQAAIDAVPGLAGLVTVDLTGSDELRFSLVSTDPSALGFDPESLATDGSMLTAAGVPPAFQPGADISFLLSVGGALPRLVTVRAPGPEQEDIGFAANEMSELAPLLAAGALDATGTIGGDAQADLTLRVFLDNGNTSDVLIMVTESVAAPGPNNTTPAELLADFNAALGSALVIAGVPGAVSASESGGVISLVGGPNVSAIEVIGADSESVAALGFTVGQKTLLTLTADDAISDFAFSGNARLVITVNGSAYDIDFAGGNGSPAALSAAIDTALANAGLAVSASVEAGHIVLAADSATVYQLSLTTVNQDLDDLLYDLNSALDLAGLSTVTADADGGVRIRLADANGESLEITHTLTFDAGVRGAELDGSSNPPDAFFDSAIGDDSELLLNLPVAVEGGLREAFTTADWDPAGMAIVGKFNPLDSSLTTFVESAPDNEDLGSDPQEVLRFLLDYDVTPANGDDPLIPIPTPPGDNTLQLVNFAEALQFNQIGAGSFIGMLGELGAALDSIVQDPLFAGYDIPFTEATLRDLVAFEDMILNAMVYDLGPDGEFDDEAYVDDGLAARLLDRIPVGASVIDPNVNYNSNGDLLGPNGFHPVPVFTTAQEMGAKLAETLDLPLFSDAVSLNTGGINPTYNPASNELTYDMDLISSDRVSIGVDDADNPSDDAERFASNFDFDVDLSPFSEFLIKAEGVETFNEAGPVQVAGLQVTLEARTTFSATYGFDLSLPEDIDPDWDPVEDADEKLLEQRFFVRDATLGGAFMGTLPEIGVEASALVGIVGIDITDIDGSFGAQFSARLHNEGDPSDSQVTLQTLQNDIKDASIGATQGDQAFDGEGNPIYAGPDQNGGQDGLDIVTNPVVSKLQRLEFDEQDPLFFSNLEAGSKLVSNSGGNAYVLDVEDGGSSGSLTVFGVAGDFGDDDAFYDVRIYGGSVVPPSGARVNGGIDTPDYFGELDMAVRVQTPADATGLGAELTELLGVSGNVDLNLLVFGDPNADVAAAVDVADLDTSLAAIGTDVDGTFVSLGQYAPVDYADLVSLLEQLGELVADLEANYPILTQILPVVNKSFSDLLGLTEGVDRAVAQARAALQDQQSLLGVEGDEVPTLTLQGMAATLRGAFGLAEDDGDSLKIDIEMAGGEPYLTLDFDILETISTTLGLDIDLGDALPNLTSGKVLRADGSLGWGFKVGVALNNADDLNLDDFKLFNPEGGLTGDLSIVGDGAEGVGMVFLAQVGEATAQVMDALVDIQLGFSLGGLDFGPDGIATLSGVDIGDFPAQLVPLQDFDVSIPLFDPAGGLTGFLGEISATGDELINQASDLLDGLPDASALAELSTLIADFDPENFNPLQNLLLLTDAADLLFENIQGLLDEVTRLPIPLVGDKLSEGTRFIEQFRDQFISQFRQIIEYTNDISLDDVTDFIDGFFEDVIELDLVDVEGFLEENGLGVADDELRWELSLGDEYVVPFDFGFDLGIPLLSLESEAALEVGVEWSLDIGLGVNQQDGAFIILDDEDGKELELEAYIDLPMGTTLKGTLGFLEVAIENGGSGLRFGIGVDLSNEGVGDGTILPIADIGNLGFNVMIDGGPLDGNDYILDFDLTVGVTDADFIIPRLSTGLMMDWSLGETGLDGVDDIIREGLDLLKFDAVSIDLDSLFGGLVGDALGELNEYLQPLLEINAFLNEDVPIISQLFGPTSLLDLAELFGLADTRLFEALDQVSDILTILGDITGQIVLADAIELFDSSDLPSADVEEFRNLLFDPDLDFGGALEKSFGDLGGFLLETGESLVTDFANAVSTSPNLSPQSKASFTNTTNLSIAGSENLIRLPWIENPEVMLGLLFGEGFSLLEIDLPPLGVGFEYDQFVTIFGPLGASIGFGFFVGADLSMGFDTYGFERFADSEFTNPAVLFDGFFLGDRENVTEGADIEELFMELTLKAAAELNLGIASGGVGGGITARLGLDYYDPDGDGAVHLSELANSIAHELRDGGNAGADVFKAIFDLQGAILAELFWYLKILTFEVGDTIFGPEEIFTFEFDFNRSPILATEAVIDGMDTLVINAGPNSVDRLNGDVSDGNESFVVEYQSGDIAIKSSSLGVNSFQVYDGNYDHILFIGGEGNDSITFQGFDESNITFDLRGGAGDDVIEFIENLGVTAAAGAGALIRGGAGNDRLIGSHLNDEIYGELGNDTIEGGRGYDILIGDNALLRDGDGVNTDKTIGALVSNLDGNDTISGGDADDIIIGGGGLDNLSGGDGADVILGDGGRFGYQLGSPHIDVSAFYIPEFVPNDRLDPDPAVSTARQMDNILLALRGIFSGTDLGDGADDVINGDDGDDIILGGAGNDIISGGGDNDHVLGGRGFDMIDGDGGDDVLFGNDQDDVINGGDGSDVIAGGFGDDTLHGDAGNDYMAGSRGRDVMFGDGGDDEMHGEGEPDIMFGGEDNDLVIGGVGADIMMGDDGIVVKYDGMEGGGDLIIGDGDANLANPYKAGADSVFGSLDLILTDVVATDGDDILSGGEGGDIMLGGGGNDLGGGDVDPRQITANDNSMTTPDGDDVIIGDGGVVEFNQRRLQRIASVFAGDPGGNTYRDTLYGDNGNDIVIGGRGGDGDNNGSDPTLNINDPALQVAFMLTGGHGPGRGATDAEVSDDDIIIGDNGELVYVGEGDDNFGKLAYIQTTDTSNASGGADTAFGEEGEDIILGGVNGSIDVLSGSTGQDVILGDNGLIHFYYDWEADGNIQDYASETYTPNDGDPSTIDLIRSFHDGLGGVDIVSGEEDSDVLIGGEEGDFVYGDNAAADSGDDDLGDIMLGDNGDLFLEGDVGRRLVQGVAVDLITTTDVAEGTGGADVMAGNAGADVIIGGVNDGGVDHLYGDRRDPSLTFGDDGDDIMLGDNGLLDYTFGPDTERLTLDRIETTARAGGGVRGGEDHVFGNAGNDSAFGGSGADRLFGDNDESADESGVADTYGQGGGNDILFGDQGLIDLVDNLVSRIASTDVDDSFGDNTEGGADHIQGNDFDDFILGGVDGDELHGEAFLAPGRGVADLVQSAGVDTILGDEGSLRFDIANDQVLVVVNGNYSALGDGDPLTLDRLETFDTDSLGGDDSIYGNGDDDLALGGFGDDLIHGDFYLGSLVRALNPGTDQLLGDGGQTFFQAGVTILLRSIETDQGGSDEVHGNDGDDTIIGGMFDDLLFGETDAANLALAAGRAGEDIILGDNGRLDWTLPDDTILGRQDVVNEFGGIVVTLDGDVPGDLAAARGTLDRITTIVPTHGGNDIIYGNGNSSADAGDVVFGGTGNDNIYGDTDEVAPNGDDGVDGSDLLFGDHGKLYPTMPSLNSFFVNNHFFSIDTQASDGVDLDGGHNDFQDVIWGNAASDMLIGGQDDDILLGGTQDDDLIGGHNVAGGHDELDDMPGVDQLAITPIELAHLDPSDVNEINDIMDGGEDDDVLAGDNSIIVRQFDDDLSPRFRMTENGLLYVIESDTVDNLADVDVGYSADVTDDYQSHQDMTLVRTITLLDHSEVIETAAAASPAMSRVFGNDIMAGAAQDDEMFGQLGDDIMQGDGLIAISEDGQEKMPGQFDAYNPAQDADPSFDIRNFNQRVDLMAGNDKTHTLRFDVFEALDDGDDYLEGNGGNDRIYGNLGQDDLIGGSSTLFGLGNDDQVNNPDGSIPGHVLRPDGADMIYGGAGNVALLARNASFGGPDNDISGDTLVPSDERHATDADTILGDNGDIFRIVVADTDPVADGDQPGYAVFNYDQDATTASGFQDFGYGGDDLTIRVRAVNLGDYGYGYSDADGDPDTRDTLEFLATARGEGDLIYGESGDDLVHGMTGDDVIFGNSEHDDLHGEIGNDFILGGAGIDGIIGDDGLIFTSRNSDQYGEGLYGIDKLNPQQTNLKKNEFPDPRSLNAEIRSPGNIQRAIINVENELIKPVELLAFRTEDLNDKTVGEFGTPPGVGVPVRFNDIIFGGLDNDFIHAGDGDDAISGAEALPSYYSGAGFEVGPNQEFTDVNTFLQNMQASPSNDPRPLTDNPFWFNFAPYNPGDILRFEGKEILEENGQRARTRDEFAWYDEFSPRRKLMFDFENGLAATAAGLNDVTALASLDDLGGHRAIDFILNFDETEGPEDVRFSDDDKPSDGDDRIFGDLGNDWQVGGTGRDHMYGGRGNDLLNMDDDHDSGFTGRIGPHDPPADPLDNKDSDEFQAYADIVYAGAGRDVMILNTGADRAIDWVGEFNSYLVPFSPFGAFHISRTLQPQIPEFLFALSDSDGIDISVQGAAFDTNALDGQLYVDQKNADVRTDSPEELRNFEPYGELGMVRQTDFDWQQQTGAPNDPQPGNLQGKREIMRRELFNDSGAAVPLAAEVGLLSLTGKGELLAAPEAPGGEVIGLYPLDTLQPIYSEILVTINADKDKAGSKSNGYVLFDYQGPENFKFAGVDVGIDKLQIGHRDASGWVIDKQAPVQMKANTDYDLTVVLFGSQATIYVNENQDVSFDFNEALNDGGLIGLGSDNATVRFDDLQVQTLPPEWTFVNEYGFDAPGNNPFTPKAGDWGVSDGQYHGSSDGQLPAVSTDSVDVAAFTRLELLGTFNSDNQGGFVFDYYSSNEFKYAALDTQNNEVIIGHYLNGQWRVDAAVSQDLESGTDYSLMVTLFGSTASVTLDGKAVVTHSFNSILNDGQFGVLNVNGSTHFDSFLIRGDDPAFAGSPLVAAGSALHSQSVEALDGAAITAVTGRAAAFLEAAMAGDFTGLDQLPIDVQDLPGDHLAIFQGDRIVLDQDGAGHGWYTGAGSMVDGIDLLSVLLHEYGHAVGLEHDSGLAFMAEELGVGERFAVSGADTVKVFDESAGEFLAQGAERIRDEVLIYDAADLVSGDDVDGVIHWRSTAGFLGRTIQLR